MGVERSDAPPLIDKLRAHGQASDSIAWNGQARQLLLWAADAIEAANVALSETAPRLPQEPTYAMLKAMAGDPVILAGSDEAELRLRYAAMLAATPACASPNSAVLSEVNAERERQDEKWGGAEHDDSHDTTVFVQLIEDYAGWARVMAGRQNGLKARRRLIQVAALAVAAVESIDRRNLGGNDHG